MGYTQEVVEQVLGATGQTEDTFLILEKIVEETKRCEKEMAHGAEGGRLNSAQPKETPSSSSASTVSRSREKERVLNKVFVEPGRSKENIKPNLRSGYSNGLGHRRQCSGSENSTQQVLFLRMSLIVIELCLNPCKV